MKHYDLVDVAKIPLVMEEIVADKYTELYKICNSMEKICRKNNGVGLSAVQIGIPYKLFIMLNEDGKFDYYANCEYIPTITSQNIYSREGCLSLKDQFFKVKRNSKVLVRGSRLTTKGFDPLDKTYSTMLNSGYSIPQCIIVQHEIDHHHGILIDQIGIPIT